MGAVRLAFRAELRRRWRSWVAVAILISVVGGLVLAAAAAGRRTESAFPAFLATHGSDVAVFSTEPVRQIAQFPGVASVAASVTPDTGQPTCHCTHPINPTDFGLLVISGKSRAPFELVSGHMPDPSDPDQVLASFNLQTDAGVQLGTIIHVPLYARSQAAAYANAVGAPPAPTGPTAALRVVGFEASEFDFPSGGTPSYSLFVTQAFARTVLPRSAVGYFYFVRLHGGAAGLPRFDAKAYSNSNVEYAESLDAQAAAVETAIHPQAVGWWILAALAALVGLAVVGQGLARQSILEGEDYPKLAALGADRRQLVTLGVARNLVVGLAGALGAVIVAVALSPIAPLGEARTAELSTGLSFDSLVLSLGALGTVVAVVALGIWPSLRAARAGAPHDRTLSARPPAVVGQLAQLGAPPTVVIGVRNAVERRSDGAPVPVGSALLGTLLAVIALCGTAVFGASLSHLTVTPRLYGDPFELNFSVPIGGGGASDPGFVRTLEHDRAIAAITEGEAVETSINHVPIDGVAAKSVEGSLLFSTVAGHLPRGAGQVALGVTTMRRVDAHLGSTVNVTVTLPSGEKRTVPFRVVSQVSFPVLSGIVSLGIGALYTVAGYDAAVCPPGPQHAACQPGVQGNNGGILARVVAGPRGRADVSHYLDAYQSITDVPTTPISLINFGEAVDFPLIFGAMLAVFGAATLAHLLVVSVSRRRREIGLLKVLGFVKGQVGAAVAWQVTTLALIGIVIGVPLGVVVGQAVWKAFANDLGVVPVSVVPVWLIAALAGGVLVVANLIAVAPALVATRFKPGELLRTS